MTDWRKEYAGVLDRLAAEQSAHDATRNLLDAARAELAAERAAHEETRAKLRAAVTGTQPGDAAPKMLTAWQHERDRAETAERERDEAKCAALRVVAVALYDDETRVTYSMGAPARHHEVINALGGMGIKTHGWEQGFLLSDGRFARRKAALLIAREAKQVLRETAPAHGLFSEDVW